MSVDVEKFSTPMALMDEVEVCTHTYGDIRGVDGRQGRLCQKHWPIIISPRPSRLAQVKQDTGICRVDTS